MKQEMDRLVVRGSWDQWLNSSLEAILYILLVFSPLAFGVVHAWSEEIVVVLAAGLCLIFLLRLMVFRTPPLLWTWAYLPVGVFLLVVILQLAPLPTGLVQAISPRTVAVKTALLGDLPDAGAVLSNMTVSFYPHATQHDLRLIMVVAAVFCVVLNFYHDSAKIKRLLSVITAVGAGIALLALAQDLAGNGKIYWVVSTYANVANCGPFIHHSHFGQFMNLSLGAAVALLLVLVHEGRAGQRATPYRVIQFLGSPEARSAQLIAGIVIIDVVAVFLSLTRGGIISLLLAAGFTVVVFSWRRSLPVHTWVMVLLSMGVFICVLWVSFDQVYDRMASLRSVNQAESGRWEIVQDILRAWTQFPLLGTGMGTHGVVYPMFDRSTPSFWAMHANNEYAQAIEETGAAGLLALVFFGVVIWFSYARSTRPSFAPIQLTTYGLGLGLLAVLVHSFSDFGQHLPANAIITAIFCGLLIILSRASRAERRATIDRDEQGGRLTSLPPSWSSPLAWTRRLAIPGVVAGVWIWAIWGADRARVAESHWNRVLAAERQLEADQWATQNDAYEYLFTHAIVAVLAQPSNIEYRHWLGAYKWLSLTRYIDPNTQQLQEQALPWARQIVEELLVARAVCPTFGATYCLAGEIEKFVLRDPNGGDHIRKGHALAPYDATACFAAARIDAEEGKIDAAYAKLVRATQLDGRFFLQAVQLCIRDLGRHDLAVQLAQGDPGRLAFVADALVVPREEGFPFATAPVPTSASQQLAEQARTKAFDQLKERCEQPDAPASAHASLANLYQSRGNVDAAVQHYRRALMKQYDQVDWHYALAQLLTGQGRTDEAIHEARICLRLRPDYGVARSLLQELSLRSIGTK